MAEALRRSGLRISKKEGAARPPRAAAAATAAAHPLEGNLGRTMRARVGTRISGLG
jgi:hypothetical protein